MKIANIQLVEHPILGNLDIDFSGQGGKVLDTVVFAGINGTGKTSLLLATLMLLLGENKLFPDSLISIDASHFPGHRQLINPIFEPLIEYHDPDFFWNKTFKDININDKPKVVYLPTEINFDKFNVNTLSFSYKYQFNNIVNRNIIMRIPSFIASHINSEVYKNQELPAKESIEKVCTEINSLFEILEIDAKLIGLNPDDKLPVFKNSAAKTFDINNLSSGEKQLFVRAMSLKMLNANNSIILIDEPEISMHPGWQQKIVSVYQKLGTNNQIIIATHSPHIVASVPKESVKLLKRENGKITVVDSSELNGSYGLPVDIVLKELMGLKTVRDPQVDNEINDLWDLLHKKQHNSETFNKQYQKLEELLGSEDEDLLLMRIEIAKLKAQEAKRNAGNQKRKSA
jgi:energy-coupling factor transporter ATP-binding protein EcfA2